jgi:hypothetical protein
MREDRLADDKRHELTEKRCEQLEIQIKEVTDDNEKLKSILSQAFGCKFLKTGDNKDCPVLSENQKRLKARCKAVCRPNEKEL